MSIKNKATLKSQIAADFPDNSVGAISPLDLRSQSIDEVDSSLNLAELAQQTVQGPVAFGTGNLTVGGNIIRASGIEFIFNESDFVVQDATTITLQAGRYYWISAPISTAKRFIVQHNVSMTSGQQSTNNVLTYTGTGVMFSGSDVSFTFDRLRYSHPNGSGFSFNDTTGGVQFGFINQSFCIEGDFIGSFDNMGALVINRSSFNCNNGLTTSGANFGIFSMTRSAVSISSASGKCVDLGTSVFSRVLEFGNNVFDGVAGSIGISGLASSGNVPSGRQAMVSGCEFDSDITALENIDGSDIRWEFDNNSGVRDSINAADTYLTGGSETVTVSAVDDWYEIGTPSAGGVSWASDLASRFTVGSDGVATYIGEKDISVRLSGIATVEKVGGGSDVIEVRLAKNWSGASDDGLEKSRAQTQNSSPTSVPVSALVDLSTGDTVRIIFSNRSGTSNIVASVSSLEILE